MTTGDVPLCISPKPCILSFSSMHHILICHTYEQSPPHSTTNKNVEETSYLTLKGGPLSSINLLINIA